MPCQYSETLFSMYSEGLSRTWKKFSSKSVKWIDHKKYHWSASEYYTALHIKQKQILLS